MYLSIGKYFIGLFIVALFSAFVYNVYDIYQDGLKYKECVKMLENEREKVNDLINVRDDYAQTIYDLNSTLSTLNTQLNILKIMNGDDNETNKDIFDDIIRIKF